MQEAEPLIALRHVTRRYGAGPTAVCAIADVSLQIQGGERIALVGPSGSGKTTLLSILGLIDQPTDGELQFNGDSVSDLTEDERSDLRRQRVGLVFQLFHLIPGLTALDNVAIPLLPYASAPGVAERASQLLREVGLGDRQRHHPWELSGGEQQRVAIARALIAAPDLLLADEPTGNLDSQTSRRTLDMLLRLQRERGFALVIATHDKSVARRMDRRLALLDGRLMASG